MAVMPSTRPAVAEPLLVASPRLALPRPIAPKMIPRMPRMTPKNQRKKVRLHTTPMMPSTSPEVPMPLLGCIGMP
ncbi:hypothetical protein STENM327S_02454 [Streptomyces tendae]